MKIRKGDKVKIIYGKEKGKESVIAKVFPKEHKIVVSGINVVTKHVKPKNRESGSKLGIIKMEKSIPMSRVLIICPKCQKPTRISFYVDKTAKKFRKCKKCGDVF